MPRRWRGVLMVEGVETGDHRIVETGAVTWRELPRDFGAIFEDGAFGHENAVVVGTIEMIERRGADIYAEGNILDDDEEADRFANMLQQGALRGVSVDFTAGEARIEVVSKDDGTVLPDDVGLEVLWGPDGDSYYVREIWTSAEVGSVAALRTPAFSDAVIEYVADAAPAAVVPEPEPAAAAGDVVTFATVDEVEVDDVVSWTDADGNAQTGTVTAVDADNEMVTVQPYDADGNPVGDPVELPVADVTVMPDDTADEEAGSSYPELARRAAARATARPALAAMLARERGDVVQASALTGHGAVLQASVAWDGGPPREWFAPLDLDVPTPLTITDDGEVFGHIALWGQCHAGFAAGQFNHCVMPERSPTEYALFHANSQVRCDDGSRIRVGVLAMDCGHAPAGRPGRRPSVASVQAHYEHTGLQAAWLRAHDGPVGPEVHGALRSGLAVDDVRRAMASRPSGDWRDLGSGLDLLGLVQVNVPAYPVYDIEEGETVVLLASLSPTLDTVARLAHSDGDCSCGGSCRAREQSAAWGQLRRFGQTPRMRLHKLDRAMHQAARS